VVYFLYITGFAFSRIGFLFNIIVKIYGEWKFYVWNAAGYGLDCIIDGISPYIFN
jgi:hypothetical protein